MPSLFFARFKFPPVGRAFRVRWRGLPAANWHSYDAQDRNYMYDYGGQVRRAVVAVLHGSRDL